MRAPKPEDFGFKPFEIEGKPWGWIIPGEYLFAIASNKWRSMMKWRDLMLDSTVSFHDILEYRRQYMESGRDYENFMMKNQICSVGIKPYSTDLKNDCKLSDVYLNKVADEAEEVRNCGCGVSRNMKDIDKVTVTNLDMCLRVCDIVLDPIIIDKIIDLVELIEEKGDEINVKDITDLQATWTDRVDPIEEAITELFTNNG